MSKKTSANHGLSEELLDRITVRLPKVFRAWVDASSIVTVIVFTIYLPLGYLGSHDFFNQWSGIFEWIKPDAILDITVILMTFQIPLVLFMLQQILAAGFVKRLVFQEVTFFKSIVLLLPTLSLMIYLAPRASYIVMPFVLLFGLSIVNAFLAFSIAAQKKAYADLFRRCIKGIVSEAARQAFQYRSFHKEALSQICNNPSIGLMGLHYSSIGEKKDMQGLSAPENKLLYDIDFKNLTETLDGSTVVADYIDLPPENLEEMKVIEGKIPGDQPTRGSESPKILLEYSIFNGLSEKGYDPKSNIACIQLRGMQDRNVDTKSLRKLLNKLQASFKYDTTRTHKLLRFAGFDELLDEIELGLNYTYDSSVKNEYKELLSWLLIVINTVDETWIKLYGLEQEYKQIKQEYEAHGYFWRLHRTPMELLQRQFHRMIEDSSIQHVQLIMDCIKSMLVADFMECDEVLREYPGGSERILLPRFQTNQLTIFKGIQSMHSIIRNMYHGRSDEFTKLLNHRLTEEVFLILVSQLKNELELSDTTTRKDFIYQQFFVELFIKAFVLEGLKMNRSEIFNFFQAMNGIRRALMEWHKPTLYTNSTDYNPNDYFIQAEKLLETRCYIFIVACVAKFKKDNQTQLTHIQPLDLLSDMNYWDGRTEIIPIITKVAIECYANTTYIDLLCNYISGDNSPQKAKQIIRELWLDWILGQNKVPSTPDAYGSLSELAQADLFIEPCKTGKSSNANNVMLRTLAEKQDPLISSYKTDAIRKIVTLILEFESRPT